MSYKLLFSVRVGCFNTLEYVSCKQKTFVVVCFTRLIICIQATNNATVNCADNGTFEVISRSKMMATIGIYKLAIINKMLWSHVVQHRVHQAGQQAQILLTVVLATSGVVVAKPECRPMCLHLRVPVSIGMLQLSVRPIIVQV